MRIKKIILAIITLSIVFFLSNVKLYASNSYFLMGCTVQNIPNGYYSSVDTTLSEAAFRENLCEVISKDYVGGSYNNAFTVDYYADADPYEEGKIQCFYTGQTIANETHGTSGWDREHIWCKSHGFKGKTKSGSESSASTNEAYNDCHHLRAAEHIANINRSDKDFGEVLEPTGENEYGCKWTDSVFEPRDEVKGDVARMLFYMMIRYGEYSKDTFLSYVGETETEFAYNLLLVDEDTTTTSMGDGRLGKLSTLLKWHYEDPVSNREIYRNNVVYRYQKNRNPFIDHPEYVDLAFNNNIGEYKEPNPVDPILPDSVTRTEVLYKTIGFEAEEGFSATSVYNTTKVDGEESTSWSINNGTVATASAINGQSLQMRWYLSTPGIMPSANMRYDVDNLSKVVFDAKYGSNKASLKTFYSLDEGLSWIEVDTVELTSSKKEYTVTIAKNGGFGKARIGFLVDFGNTLPESNTSVIIDNVKLYRAKDMPGLEFEKETTKANLKFTYDSYKETATETYYKKVTDISEITDGSEFVIASANINTYPYILNDTLSSNKFLSDQVTVKPNGLYFDNATTLTLVDGINEGTYGIKLGTKYIGNNTATDVAIKKLNDVSIDSSWTITIDEFGVASIVLVEDSEKPEKRRVLSYNDTSTNHYFGCYKETRTTEVSIYKKIVEEVTNTIYTYNDTYLRFAGFIKKDMYDEILSFDSNATFGIALSKDGITYNNYECEVEFGYLEVGKFMEDSNGDYVSFAVKVLTPKEHFSDLVYAKAYTKIDEDTYYMQGVSYSVSSLIEYYLNNYTWSYEMNELLGGLAK